LKLSDILDFKKYRAIESAFKSRKKWSPTSVFVDQVFYMVRQMKNIFEDEFCQLEKPYSSANFLIPICLGIENSRGFDQI